MLKRGRHNLIKIITRQIHIDRGVTSTGSSSANQATKYLVVNTDQASCEHRVEDVRRSLRTDLALFPDFLTQSEHDVMMLEIDRSFRRTKYQYDHWDGVGSHFVLCSLPSKSVLTIWSLFLVLVPNRDFLENLA